MKADRKIDIRGEVFPYTFVKSKLALEELESGQILEIMLDNSQAAENVPRSMESDGHMVLGVEKVGKDWRIFVRKT
ncbi:MAG: sulfurtransferase TusA family protein [Candidatus Hadarchaeaceae archaeon]